MKLTQTCPLSSLSFLLAIAFAGLLALALSAWMIRKEKTIDWVDKRAFKLIWGLQTATFIAIAMFCLYTLLYWFLIEPKT